MTILSLQTSPTRRFAPLWAIFIVLIWLLGVGLFHLFASSDEHTHTLCLFRTLTGIPCPTCGTTRCVLAASRGHFIDAFLFSPFMSVVLVLMLLWIVLRVGFRKTLVFNIARRYRIVVWTIIALLFAANWMFIIWRELTSNY